MTDTQRAAYGDSTEVRSDALGLTPRDNRNHRKKQQIILETTAAKPGDRVLEVGCGSGLHAVGFAERFDYTGVDLSPSLVDETQHKLGDKGRAMEMDAMNLEFEDGEFDAVVGTAVLHHLSDPEQALSEWIRVTETGGSISLMEPNYLFPKDFVMTQFIEHEKHKKNMAPWRLRPILDSLGVEYRVTPHIYTPPWPEAASGVFDAVDDVARRVPGVRAGSQMLLIHIKC